MEIPIIDIPIEEAIGEGGSFHKAGTLVLTIAGPQAYKVSYGLIASMLVGPLGIGPNGVVTVYRCDQEQKFYATLSQAAHVKHYNNLHSEKNRAHRSRNHRDG